MKTGREKLIELLSEIWGYEGDESGAADYLIASGVTFETDTNVGSKWISVEDRLPDKTVKCLVYQTGYGALGGFVDIATYTPCYNGIEGDQMNGRQVWYKYSREWGEYEAHNVTHWMPQPEPPKEDKHDSNLQED